MTDRVDRHNGGRNGGQRDQKWAPTSRSSPADRRAGDRAGDRLVPVELGRLETGSTNTDLLADAAGARSPDHRGHRRPPERRAGPPRSQLDGNPGDAALLMSVRTLVAPEPARARSRHRRFGFGRLRSRDRVRGDRAWASSGPTIWLGWSRISRSSPASWPSPRPAGDRMAVVVGMGFNVRRGELDRMVTERGDVGVDRSRSRARTGCTAGGRDPGSLSARSTRPVGSAAGTRIRHRWPRGPRS